MIGGLSPWHLGLIAFVALLLLGGGGKLSAILGDAAKGIRTFKDELKGGDATAAAPAQLPPKGQVEPGGTA